MPPKRKTSTDLLRESNANLAAMFAHIPGKHVPIKAREIAQVYSRNVLSVSADAKTVKGVKRGYLTGVLYLAPAKMSGINLCYASSAGCRAACLFSAGRGGMYCTTRSRLVKTLAYLFDKPRFTASIKRSIDSLIVKAKNSGMTPIVRLNGTSDIAWESDTDIMQSYPSVQFYDYTAIPRRLTDSLPANYDLTFSLKEDNEAWALVVLSKGFRVAAVFSGTLPDTFMGYPVTGGDSSDLRFLDSKACVVGLSAKGKARKDTSGFVRNVNMIEIRKVA